MRVLSISVGLVGQCFQMPLSFETVLVSHMRCSRLQWSFGVLWAWDAAESVRGKGQTASLIKQRIIDPPVVVY